jgi:hypothetical protein
MPFQPMQAGCTAGLFRLGGLVGYCGILWHRAVRMRVVLKKTPRAALGRWWLGGEEQHLARRKIPRFIQSELKAHLDKEEIIGKLQALPLHSISIIRQSG